MDQPSDIKGIFLREPIEQHYITEITNEIFKERVYDPYFNGKSGLVVVDLGANIGLFSWYARRFAKIVYAIEPSAQHKQLLDYMVTFNNFENIKTYELAIGNANEQKTLYHTSNVTAYNLFGSGEQDSLTHEQVEVVTIEKLMELLNIEHIDFLKLDIEGMEAEVLGGEAFKNVCSKIDVIMGENHTWNGRNPAQIENVLKDRGFDFQWLEADAQLFVARRIK